MPGVWDVSLLRGGPFATFRPLPGESMSTQRYRQAGVDIDAGEALVDRIVPFARLTSRPEVMGGIGHFGALWSVPTGRFKDLVLVSSTDGCGTKVKVAQLLGRHSTIGIDLVAMCVNDVLCVGAEPFFFLDYFACGRLDVDVAASVIEGIAKGCQDAGCALVGGETAEMPGVYGEGIYDLAGFVVGGCERSQVLDGSGVHVGMKAVALGSSGLHSNGYSLARKVLFEELGLAPGDELPGCGESVGDVLIRPTRIYVKPVLHVLRHFRVGGVAHITGGGVWDNLPRVLPPGAAVRLKAWELPPLFRTLEERGGIDRTELLRTFNCGVGMILLVERDQCGEVVDRLRGMGENAWEIGEVVRRDREDVPVSFE